ncbi:glycosyltransferase 87 family protein [Aerosakkonemataceae cyanobacterium BLCC-F50]|uniref:Glycosyltransferase 87 family protein n=1 Tax=Floridaenema flaviceps BLCC-F50 TaxID=3153642 RepID=A0ABV4XU27_9CYAN
MKLNPIEKFFTAKDKPAFTVLVYAIAVLLAIVLPIILWPLNLSFISRTYDGSVSGMVDTEPFELFGLFISIVLIAFTWSRLGISKRLNLNSFILAVLPLLVSLNLLWILIDISYHKASDYLCYENAARSILNELNPYLAEPRCYLYPPLPAQVLAFLYKLVNSTNLLPKGDTLKVWNTVFYLYQCGQFFQIILAYYLTYHLARRMGLKNILASLIVSGLFLFNEPLFRTIKFDQINVWVLNTFLLALLFLRSRPFVSGLAVALGAHIKLYTLALLLPWSFIKRRRAILAVVVGFFAISLIQTNWGQDWTLWQQFLIYFQNPEKPNNYRNSSIRSFVYNLFKIPATFIDKSYFNFVPTIVAVINLLILVWFIVRLIERERGYRQLKKDSLSGNGQLPNDLFILYGHSIDAIALGLLISPSVWEHHYVIAIPLALWALTTGRWERRRLVGVGTFLIFCLPTFDVFPLGHCRMVGLLILIYATSPNFVGQYFLLENKRKIDGLGLVD